MTNYIPDSFDTSISDAEIQKHKKTIPTGTQDFADIIEIGRLYVDKTPYISQWLLEGQGNTNLMHRPRRFGKTLTLSVIKEIYSHNKVLFKGTQLTEEFWEKMEPRPVISLSFAVRANANPIETLEETIRETMLKQMKKLRVLQEADLSLAGPLLLQKALSRLTDDESQKRPVILIDEYDSLLVRAYQMGESLEKAASVIAEYIYPLKYQSPSIHASYVIGIMKSRGLELMSAVNNPTDKTFAPEYAQMIGFTMQEIQKYFMPEVTKLSRLLKMSIEEVLQQIKSNYNGYVFNPQNLEETVYAGYSFCTFLSDSEGFYDYWYSTGGIQVVYRRCEGQLDQLETLMEKGQIDSSMKDLKLGYHSNSPNNVALTTLLFYHGYLTFKSIPESDNVILHFPNNEVRRAFTRNHLEYAYKIDPIVLEQNLRHLDRFIKTVQIEDLVLVCSTLISQKSYAAHSPNEKYYSNTIHDYLRAIYGDKVQMEQPVAGGVLDIVLKLPDLIYIFEFKYVATHSGPDPLIIALKNASEQILSKRYFESFLGAKRLISLGIVISGTSHNIVGYQIVQDLNSQSKETSLQSPAEPFLFSPEKIAEKGLERAAEPIEELRKRKSQGYSPASIQPAIALNDENEKLKVENLRLKDAQEKQELKLALAEAEKAQAQAEKEKLLLILRLKSDGMSGKKIRDLLKISHDQWKDITGEDLSVK